jgi:hypothetical protein
MDKDLINHINMWRKVLEEYVAAVSETTASRNVKMVIEDMALFAGKLLEPQKED